MMKVGSSEVAEESSKVHQPTHGGLVLKTEKKGKNGEFLDNISREDEQTVKK